MFADRCFDRILEGVIWRGDQRPLKYDGKAFQRSFGLDAQACVYPTLQVLGCSYHLACRFGVS